MSQNNLDLEESMDELHFFLIKAVAADGEDATTLAKYYGSAKQLVPLQVINEAIDDAEKRFKQEHYCEPEFTEINGIYYLGHGTYRDFNPSVTH